MYFAENDEYYIGALRGLEKLFVTANVHWSQWIRQDIAEYMRFGRTHHHLSAFGGMGSINDCYLCAGNHTVTNEAEPWTNVLIEHLLSISWALARTIERGDSILLSGIGVFTRRENIPIEGWKCMACGYARLNRKAIDAYLAKTMLPSLIYKALMNQKLEELVEDCFSMNMPGVVEQRHELIMAAQKSKIHVEINEMRLCPSCKRSDVAVYRWNVERKKTLFHKEQLRLFPASDNLGKVRKLK